MYVDVQTGQTPRLTLSSERIAPGRGGRATTVGSFTKEVNPRLAKRPLKTNGRLANRGLTSLVKEPTAGVHSADIRCWSI